MKPDPNAPISSDRHPMNMWLQGTLDDDDAIDAGFEDPPDDDDDDDDDEDEGDE